jgi:signal transduction histidine kinase
MNPWKRLELEWKILIVAGLLFAAFAWPVQKLFISRLQSVLEQSIDPRLEEILRSRYSVAQPEERESVKASLERNRQWQVLLPMIINEQRRLVVGFSVVLFIALFVFAVWTLRRLTRPLKNLAVAVDLIGKGETVAVIPTAGGALGAVERAVGALQEELGILREKARIQGMETAWKDIARIMAHEIKNPLTPIRLTLDRMDERIAAGEVLPPEMLRTFVARINGQVDMLERLVNQFRSFSREPEVHLKPVRVRDAVAAVGEAMAASLKTQVDGDEVISADPYLLNQVLLNVWKNSLEAAAGAMAVSIGRTGNRVAVTIRDNGHGIAPADIERVWLPYVTLKTGGTGLGLPVVKRLVETMGGTVSLRSATDGPERGVAVLLTFAAADSQAAKPAPETSGE